MGTWCSTSSLPSTNYVHTPVRHDVDVALSSTPLYDHVHTQYAMDACCSHTPFHMYQYAHVCLLYAHYTRPMPLQTPYSCMDALSTPSRTMYTPSTPYCCAHYTHPYDHVHTPYYTCLEAVHRLHALCGHVHTQLHVWRLRWHSPLPSKTMYTPSTPWMLSVRTLNAPTWPCTHLVRHVWLMLHSSTHLYDHLPTQYAMDACCDTSSLPSTTNVHTQYAMDACCTHTTRPHVAMYRPVLHVWRRVALLHSPLRQCTHAVHDRCLLMTLLQLPTTTIFTPRTPWILLAVALLHSLFTTMYTPSTPSMLVVRTLHAPMWSMYRPLMPCMLAVALIESFPTIMYTLRTVMYACCTQTTLPHVAMYRLRNSCMAAVAHLHSPLRQCTHPVHHRCLRWHFATPYVMYACCGIPHSPPRLCTHPLHHECFLWHFPTPLYDQVHTPYAMDACCTTSPLPSTTMYTPSTPWMLAVRTLHANHVNMYTYSTPWMLAVALPHSLQRSFRHPVRHVVFSTYGVGM